MVLGSLYKSTLPMTSFEPDGDYSLRLAKDTVSTTILQKQEVEYRIQGHHIRQRQRPKLLFPSSICAWLHFSHVAYKS